MSATWEIVKSGVESARSNPRRHAATFLCLVIVLAPYLTGMSLIRGRRIAEACPWRGDANLIVEGRRAGRLCWLPLDAGEALRSLPGVERVSPQSRFSAWAPQFDGPVAVVGGEASRSKCATGRWYAADDECTLGATLARHRGLRVGDVLYLRADVDAPHTHELRVVGVLSAGDDGAAREACHVSWHAADAITGDAKLVSRFLVHCPPTYEGALRREIAVSELAASAAASGIRWNVERRESRLGLVVGRSRLFEAIWTAWFAPGLAACVFAISLTSGLALDERRREVALLKSFGWSTTDVIARATSELASVSLAAAVVASAAAAVWSEAFRGIGIVHWALPDAFESVPVEVMRGGWSWFTLALAAPIGLICGLTGGVYSTWRAAIAPVRSLVG